MSVELQTNLSVTLTREFRQRLIRRISFLLCCLTTASLLQAGRNSSADFLKIPIGAEAAALGQAITSLSYGVTALNANPAGLAIQPQFLGTSSFGLGFSHQDQFLDTSLDHLGLVTPQSKNNLSAGFNIVRLAYGTQKRRDENRQEVGSFSASDMFIGAAVAKNFETFQLGTQIKWVRMDLAGFQAEGVAADFGFLTSHINGSPFSLGFSARNVGPKMKFVSEEFNLPLTYALGTAYRLIGPLTLSLEAQHRPHQNQTTLAFGTQMSASNNVILRAGYSAKVADTITNNQKSETNRGSVTSIAGLAAGLGIRINQFTIDYAISPFGELGNNHTLMLSSWFGASQPNRFDVELTDPIVPELPLGHKEQPALDDRRILILPIQEDPLNRQLK